MFPCSRRLDKIALFTAETRPFSTKPHVRVAYCCFWLIPSDFFPPAHRHFFASSNCIQITFIHLRRWIIIDTLKTWEIWGTENELCVAKIKINCLQNQVREDVYGKAMRYKDSFDYLPVNVSIQH